MMQEELCFEKLSGEMTPLYGFSNYMVHCPTGNVWSKLSNKWLLIGAKGTGDNNKYLMTTLIDDNGNKHNLYLSEIVMSSYLGAPKSYWRNMGMEIDHINRLDTKNNSISNLRLATSTANKKNSSSRSWNKIRLSMETAQQLREEFINWTGSKIEWYKAKGKLLGVTSRSIQNVVLNYTYTARSN
ncbi:HNH endonuclease [Bacillus sp. AFS017336]|uniref:HNH endonuclease n=1 Tax=Bacillus sp. AFS017336 TaxID=2033489 RepID=UPI000BF1511F|nr:HNH endonuclease [Bacillus sp. AFS017336]PEL13777.1 hypothetical protein CN601_03430 [Bacillus sp. AFS017336]